LKYKLVDEGNEASELQATIEANISKKPIPEIEILPMKDIEKEIKSEILDFVGHESDVIPSIDFTVLANGSDFKRLIYRAITGKTWRGSNKGLELSLKKLKNRLRK